MTAPEIALSVSQREWPERLHQFVADHGGARVRTRVMGPGDALAEAYDVLLVDDVTSFLTRRLVTQVRARGSFVIGVFDPDESEEGKQRLLALDVDDVIEASASPDEFLVAIRTLVITRTEPRPDHDQSSIGTAPPSQQRGTIIVVTAVYGGTGATEAAVGISVGLSGRRRWVALVDADDRAPAIAPRLSLDIHPNLLTAIDDYQHGTGNVETSLMRVPRSSVAVLPGLPSARAWLELRADDVLAVVHQLGQTHRYVVVNGAPLPDGSRVGAPGSPLALAERLVGDADAVVCVGGPSPVDIARIVNWLADFRAAVNGSALQVVVNRAPRSAFRRAEIARELADAYRPLPIVFAPVDTRVDDAAWRGSVPRKGPFARAMQSVANAISVRG